MSTRLYALDADGKRSGDVIAAIPSADTTVAAGSSATVKGSVTLTNPGLWGPPPTQRPNRYVAITTVSSQGTSTDTYETPFGIRDLRFDPNQGVVASLDRHPYVAGGFVRSGWDYLGEPTPYYSARSSYYGVIDLAGFPKDRFFLYQSQWRPELPLAHIVPHWTWPERQGQTTPVHVFTSGDEAELFLNGRSLGRKRKGQYEYRLRWDDVQYEPGTLEVVAYRKGGKWTTAAVKTAGAPAALEPDRIGRRSPTTDEICLSSRSDCRPGRAAGAPVEQPRALQHPEAGRNRRDGQRRSDELRAVRVSRTRGLQRSRPRHRPGEKG